MKNEFVSRIKQLIRKELNELHTAIPGEIIEVDGVNGRVSVKPNAKLTFSDGDILEYPILTDVPIVMPCCNDEMAIAFPVHVGDHCLVVFSEQSIDDWLDVGTNSSNLKHDLSGAIAIPGLMKVVSEEQKDAISRGEIIIKNKSNQITLSKDAITIRGTVNVEGNLTLNGKDIRP